MGFRFRRTIRVIPGIRLNLSRSGISTSVGIRGAHVTAGHGRIRETAGIPGSGLSYTESQITRQAHGDGAGAAQPRRRHHWILWTLAAILGLFAAMAAFIWIMAAFG